MTLPLFSPDNDPGPDFAELVRRAGLQPPVPDVLPGGVFEPLTITHGTTVVAIRYTEGVVMAGGTAMEMVKLFQLQLEHYEKVEGSALSLEGKANQLGQMVRQHLPAAMQGMAVVPLFAGYDLRREAGRLFQYDVTGGRYEESNFAATGSGSMHAGTVVKLGFREGLERGDTLDLALAALWQAADEDSATGGPDPIRGIYPVVASITRDGFTRVAEDEIAERFDAYIGDITERERGSRRVAETTDLSGGEDE